MNEKPILFNGDMVRAILDGRKTQTRRVIKPQPTGFHAHWTEGTTLAFTIKKKEWECPYAKRIGDRLWVREAHCWADQLAYGIEKHPAETVGYRADSSALHMGVSLDTYSWNWDMVKWRPSIFMPRWASRITLRVTDVRVERVQEIDKKNAIAEGIQWREAFPEGYTVENDYDIRAYDAVLSFKKLWDRINAKRGYGWDVNPWVWVVEFELASPHPAPRNENTTSTSGQGGGEGGQ
jgi:hypothetical protein